MKSCSSRDGRYAALYQLQNGTDSPALNSSIPCRHELLSTPGSTCARYIAIDGGHATPAFSSSAARALRHHAPAAHVERTSATGGHQRHSVYRGSDRCPAYPELKKRRIARGRDPAIKPEVVDTASCNPSGFRSDSGCRIIPSRELAGQCNTLRSFVTAAVRRVRPRQRQATGRR